MKRLLLTCAAAGTLLMSCAQGNSKKDLVAEQQQLQQEQLNLEKQKLEFQKQQMQFQEEQKADSLAKVQEQESTTDPAIGSSANNGGTRRESQRPIVTNNTYRTNRTEVVREVPARRRGMSARAKGAIIGGAVGATAGAIIPRHDKGLGAVIGGVVGAGTGYTIGKAKDRKTGRL